MRKRRSPVTVDQLHFANGERFRLQRYTSEIDYRIQRLVNGHWHTTFIFTGTNETDGLERAIEKWTELVSESKKAVANV